MIAIFLFLLIGLATAASIDDIQPFHRVDKPYIVGGTECPIQEIPYQGALYRRGFQGCGTIVISNYWHLTAAHCTIGYTPSDLTVRVGNETKSAGTLYEIVQIVIHPNYSSGKFSYDCSVIKTAKEMDFGDNCRRVLLPVSGYEYKAGDIAITSGWGYTISGGSTTEKVRKVAVPITTKQYCENAYPGSIDDTMLCAGYTEGDKDSCQGDSGGPLVHEKSGELVGIVSWGRGCALPGYPGVYCRVAQPDIRSWIARICGV